MCGISGIIDLSGNSVPLKDIKLMNDLVSHRGPDGEGFHIDRNFALGHRRLSILDLSEAGAQPMKLEDLWITFNGEIFNYKEIRLDLEALGHHFHSGSDTEVILAAYKQWGEDCVKQFNGMWAFAIYDVNRQTIFCSRDRFGVKPFYYFKDDKYFVFGSELKQMLVFTPQTKANRQMLFDYLFLGYHQHTEETFFQDVYKLPGSHNLTFDLKNNSFKIQRYYKLEANKAFNGLDLPTATEKFKTLMDDSIRLRLRSDVKVGTCLSGGLDSSYIATVASRLYKQSSNDQFNAITAKSTEKASDETPYAKKVVDHSNLKWTICEPTGTDFLNVLDHVIAIQEEPFGGPSIVMQYYVMQQAAKSGCKVMLDGQGGDEILLGYERYFIKSILSINPIKFVKAFFKINRNSRLTVKEVFSYLLYFGIPKFRERTLKRRARYIKKEFDCYFNKNLLNQVSPNQNLWDLQYTEITKTQLPHLLQYEDRNSMFHSVEARVPFVDYRVVEAACSLPIELKIHDGWSKYILRIAGEKILPSEITWRKDKLGFNAPAKTWIDKTYFLKEIKNSKFLSAILSPEHVNDKLRLDTIWKLYNISKWATIFNVSF
jgi:asparagine synthase (glutamine-hydrolysing)